MVCSLKAPGQNKPVSNTINEKAALMAAKDIKIISSPEIISISAVRKLIAINCDHHLNNNKLLNKLF